MIARAPGKLFVTGAYAVLEGAPAVVVAVDRYATADAGRVDPGTPRPEVAAVARRLGRPAPVVDTSAQETNGRKLGLGSSAAAAVAAAAATIGGDPRYPAVRRRVFALAREAHAEIQPRGSGGDVAASTFGGTVIVQRASDGAALDVQTTTLPEGLVFRPVALARSARTSDALDRLAERRDRARAPLASIAAAADRGASALSRGDVGAFVEACAAHVAGLAALGDALDLALVPPELARARHVLDRDTVVLLPSGAGGGDTVLWLSARGPTHQEVSSLEELGLAPLDSSVDTLGVHRLERS